MVWRKEKMSNKIIKIFPEKERCLTTRGGFLLGDVLPDKDKRIYKYKRPENTNYQVEP